MERKLTGAKQELAFGSSPVFSWCKSMSTKGITKREAGIGGARVVIQRRVDVWKPVYVISNATQLSLDCDCGARFTLRLVIEGIFIAHAVYDVYNNIFIRTFPLFVSVFKNINFLVSAWSGRCPSLNMPEMRRRGCENKGFKSTCFGVFLVKSHVLSLAGGHTLQTSAQLFQTMNGSNSITDIFWA